MDTPTQSPLIEIMDLTVDFASDTQLVRALHGVNISVAQGETLGVVGESGCGKSITWMAALGLLSKSAQVAGSVSFAGQNLLDLEDNALNRVRGGSIAMIFQDPSSSLNPLRTIGWQLKEALALHRGMRGRAADIEAVALLDRVGVSDAKRHLGDYPHEFSGGMNQRVMIAMALAGDPSLLIADEPTTALDATIQAQILDLLIELKRERGMGLVLISHDLAMVSEMADRIVVMYCGRVVEDTPTSVMFDEPAHPYTRGLIAAMPEFEGPRRRLFAIPGSVPAPTRLPSGCFFAPRCQDALPACSDAAPELQPVSAPGAHLAACIRLGAPEAAALRGTA